jgi:hypothetical protein
MNVDGLLSNLGRLLFVGAFVLAVLAVIKGIVQLTGGGMLGDYTPGRLMEFAAILLVFVVTILLREIRDKLQGTS